MKKYFEPETLKKINSVDLLSWLLNTDPGRLKKINNYTYCLSDHDSLKISNGKWFWWSKGYGGGNAISFLQKVENMSFMDAANKIYEEMNIESLEKFAENKSERPNLGREKAKVFKMPMIRYQPEEAISYLKGRGISDSVIEYFVNQKMISESYDKKYVIFFGTDESGAYRYGFMRSIIEGKNEKRECSGSDKTYAFKHLGNKKETLHVFEAAIDMLSYASLLPDGAFQQLNLLSLGGVHQTSNNTLPQAMQHILTKMPEIKKVYLHFDNDEAGSLATNQISIVLSRIGIDCVDNRPALDKDINEYLQRKQRQAERREAEL